MCRFVVTLALIISAAPLWAENLITAAKVDRVTLSPGLAEVTRLITLDLPPGQHEVTVPDLPENMSADGLRLTAPAGVALGAVSLAFDRLPVTPDLSSPAIAAAEAEIARLEEALRDTDSAIARIQLRASAAEAQLALLQALSQTRAAEMSAAEVASFVQMVGAETLKLQEIHFATEEEVAAAQRNRAALEDALRDARQALAALIAPGPKGRVLTFDAEAEQAGRYVIEMHTLEGFANWSPVYDLRLTSGETPTLAAQRSVVISQVTGQDWQDVMLTLSTARPRGQIAPSPLFPELRQIVSQDDLARRPGIAALASEGVVARSLADTAAPALTAEVITAGAVVSYRYPSRVTIRDGVEDLRLDLDTLDLPVALWAAAVPRQDATAYRMVTLTNATPEPFLPGPATLFADGAMIGQGQMPLLAAGAETDLGFGPIDGIRLTRATPRRSAGDRGVFNPRNQLVEEAVITLENLTDQPWDIRLRDTIPYSEQDDLTVSYTASPPVTRADPDGQRGFLEWQLPLPAESALEVTLSYTLSWPEGYVLR